MGDIITFKKNPSPSFVGGGSKIEHPDVLPIFRGANWLGDGDQTVVDIMHALYSIVNGPYLSGLTQYGYVGPVQVRNSMVDPTPFTIDLPPLGPNVTQTDAVISNVGDYIHSLLDHDRIDNVDDNHDLIVIVFLDPSIPGPVDMDAMGKPIHHPSGSNTSVDIFDEVFDDNTRFEYIWIICSGSLASITKAISHELVEAISDPFDTGWEQNPLPDLTSGQIADVCDQSGIVNGVAVAAYWSIADDACILPTAGTRQVRLWQSLDQQQAFDGPQEQGFVAMPLICGGGQFFSYFERTYHNFYTLHIDYQGYESPVVECTINGQNVPILEGDIVVDAVWDEPRSNPLFPDFYLHHSPTTHLKTWKPGPGSTEIKFDVGPNAGNINLNVVVTVSESFDNPVAGGGSTFHRAFLDFDVTNQEICWEGAHDDAVKNCDRMEHWKAGVPNVFGPPQPGDPPGMVETVIHAVEDHSASRRENLLNAAHLVASSRPAVAEALAALAQREV